MSKNLCACGCRTKITPRNNKGKRGGVKFAPGHNFATGRNTGVRTRRSRRIKRNGIEEQSNRLKVLRQLPSFVEAQQEQL